MELNQLQAIYAEYEAALVPLQKKVGILTGLFGQRSVDDPRNAPCNREFYERVRQWTEAFAGEPRDQQALVDAARFLLEAPERHPKSPAYWYELVAQEFLKNLLPQLSRESKAMLAQHLDTLYPRKKRLPFQDALYVELTR